MALFGKKKAADVTPAPDNGAVNNGTGDVAAPAVAPPVAAKAVKVKAPRAPKASGTKGGTVVGLNIGNAYIKAVEVTSKGGQLSVTGVGVIATPPESYANGNVLSVNALTNALRTMWKQAGLSSKATVFSVAGTGSLVVRVIEVPRMTDGELADNMRVDADRYIPFPPSEVVMDVQALRDLPTDPDAANMEVLLAAAQREIIDLHVAVVQKSKLTPRAIDVEPLALARMMQLELRAQNPIIDYDDVTAVLNIGQTGTEITILRGDIVVFTRTVPNGGGNLTRAIAETMGIPTSDAERLKIERGNALPPTGYGESAEGDDFGFGGFDDGGATVDFGGGGFGDDFGDDAVVVAPTTTAPTAAATSAPATPATSDDANAAPTSDDPFDLDFFDQGPQQSEPGAGHGQKEDDEDDAPSGINFSFDQLDDDLTPTRPNDVTPASPPPPASLDDFDLPDTYLPAMSASAAPAPASTPAIPSAFDFSDFDLPTQAAPAVPAAAPTQKLSDDTTTQAATSAPVPAPVNVAAAPVVPAAPAPSGFSFGFSNDEPAATKAAPNEADTNADEAFEPLNFEGADDEVSIAPVADAPAAISFEKQVPVAATDAPVSLNETDEAVEDGDGFDLDDVFGTPAATGASAVGTVSAADANFDAGVGQASDDFDVSAFGAMSDDEGDDFSSFGSGLSQTGETDDDTLYAAMQPVLDDLATEVRRSLEFHLGRYPDTTFSRLVLVGGGAKLRNLDEFLTGNLGVPTSVGNPFAHIKVSTPGLPPEFVPTNAPLCAVALGLALRDFIE